MLQAFGQVVIVLAILGAVLLGLYGLTRFLPGAWRERGQVLRVRGAGRVPRVRRAVRAGGPHDLGELPRRQRQRAGSGSTTTRRSSPGRAPG